MRELAQRHTDAARMFRQSSAVGGVLAAVGVRWLEEEFSFPSEATRRAATQLRARWRETPTYRQHDLEVNGLVDEVRSLLSRIFTRPLSLAEVRKAVLVSTKCQRLDTVLDAAVGRAERWVASGKPLPGRVQRAPVKHLAKPRGPRSGSRVPATSVSNSHAVSEIKSSSTAILSNPPWARRQRVSTLAAFLGIAAFVSGASTIVLPIGYAILSGLGSALALTIFLRTTWTRSHSRRLKAGRSAGRLGSGISGDRR